MQRKTIDLSKNALFWRKQKSLESILCHACQTTKRVKKRQHLETWLLKQVFFCQVILVSNLFYVFIIIFFLFGFVWFSIHSSKVIYILESQVVTASQRLSQNGSWRLP